MMLKIPPSVQVGAHTFSIRFSDKWLDAAGVRGSESCKDQIIRLHKGQSVSATFEALIHELDHIVSYVFGIESGSCEEAVVARGAGLTQVLMSMGIEPDFSEIPDEEL